MRMIALDQASAITGYAVFEDGEYLQSGVIDLHKNHDAEMRVKQMMLLVSCLIRSKHADVLVMEDAFQHSNVQTFKMLTRLQGAIMFYCYDNEIPFRILTPNTWRSSLGFEQGSKVKRWKLKQQAIDYIEEKCGKKLSDDEADAACIGFAAIKDNIFN